MKHVYSKCATVLYAIGLSVFFITGAFPQASDLTQLSGLVTDPSDAVMTGARVTVTHQGTGAERTSVTNASGYYTVLALPSGLYTISVEAPEFKKFQTQDNKLDPGIPARVDLKLEVGAVTEVVQVTAAATPLQAEGATLGKLIGSQQMKYMMLNGRNPIWLALLKPGVTYQSTRNFGGFSFTPLGGAFSINGSRTVDNVIIHDGAQASRTRTRGREIGVANVDVVQEVQILTANYSAEYGGTAGGQVRIVTKSGTRDFHGEFFEFFRNDALDANSWTRNRSRNPETNSGPRPFRYNQFGYMLSGPAYIPGKWNTDRSKAFFLVSHEWMRFRRFDQAVATVPSPLMREGDFGEIAVPNNLYFKKPQIIMDPLSGEPFVNNIIPPSRQSPNGMGLIRAMPNPTPGFLEGNRNWIRQAPRPQNQIKSTYSFDYYPADQHQFRYRLSQYDMNDLRPFRGGTDRVTTSVIRPNSTQSLNWTWVLSPTVVHEFLATFSVGRYDIRVDAEGPFHRRSQYGIDYPYIFADQGKEVFDKIPTIDIGSAPFPRIDGSPYPARSRGPVYTVSDKMTVNRVDHTFKFGFNFERMGNDDLDQIGGSPVPGSTNNQNGRFAFSDGQPNATGVAIGNAALGIFNTYAEIGARNMTPYRSNMYEWFVEDSWKVTPRFTMDMGVRYSIIQPFWSLWRNMSIFDPDLYEPSNAVEMNPKTGLITSGELYNGMAIPGDGFTDGAFGRVPIADTGEFNFLFRGVRNNFMDTHYKDFQPRLGLAYRFNDKTVLRAGVGRYITRLTKSDRIFLGGNPPFQPQVSTSDGSVDDPGGGKPAEGFPFIVTTFGKNWRNQESWVWNVTLGREIGFDTNVEVSYVGRRGLFGQRERNINQLLPGTRINRDCPAPSCTSTANVNFLRPFRGYGPLRVQFNDAFSRYNALQIEATRRFTKGLSFGIAYAFSKLRDDGSHYRDLTPNAYDVSNMWGYANQDMRHVLTINYIWELPFFREKSTLAGKLLGGWVLSGITQMATGFPGNRGTIESTDDFAGVGTGSGRQFWDMNGDPISPSGERRFSEDIKDDNFWFRTKNADGSPIFTRPAPGTFSTTAVRNLIHDPGFQHWNFALSKHFFITERQNIQFRLEMYNFPNHPNWSGVNRNPRSSFFGKVTSKRDERQLQLSLRYSF